MSVPALARQMPRLFLQIDKSRSVVTVMLGTKQFRRNANVERIYEAANRYRLDQSQENLDRLMTEINPANNYRPVFGGLFVMDEKDVVYLTGTNVPVPDYLVQRMTEDEKNGYDFTYLVNFWRNCLLNPYDDCRRNLFEYCAKYGVPITDLGYAVMYKALAYKTGEAKKVEKSDLAHFVGESYDRVKKQKKGLARFNIFSHTDEAGDLSFRLTESDEAEEGEALEGNLKKLHDNLENLSQESETVYTDKWTGTMEIKLGQAVRKDHGTRRTEYAPGRSNCSAFGLHAGSFDYVKQYASMNDVVLMVLINPKDLTVVHLGEAKIQTTQYFTIGVMERTGKENVTHYDFEEIPSGYYESDFADYELRESMRLLEENASNPQEALIKQRMAFLERHTRPTLLALPEAIEGSDEII